MTFWTEEQRALRASAKAFVRKEIAPHLQDWEDNARILGIGGGATEVLNDLTARLLGYTA